MSAAAAEGAEETSYFTIIDLKDIEPIRQLKQIHAHCPCIYQRWQIKIDSLEKLTILTFLS